MLSTMAAEDKLLLTDDDFLSIVDDEYSQSIGLDTDDDLASNRERALEYIKGEMNDLRVLPNRSAAVSTDVSDALETVLPDIMEVFTGGEDVATFRPQGEEDVEGAAQETDYVNHVFFNENRGWLTLYTHVKDALSVKIGVNKVWGERYETVEEERFEGKTQEELQLIAEAVEREGGAEIVELEAGEPDPETGAALWSFTLRRTLPQGKACVMAVPPEDFGVARDTTLELEKASYCVMRSRPRAQDLIADGYDPDLVADLSPYGSSDTDTVQLARDNAGESDDATGRSSSVDFNLHQVEIHEHYIRVDADGDGQPELWCVVTSADQSVLLKKERVNRIPFAVSTPFIVTHRLFGRSLFDLLGEVQKIKTALLRIMLDSGYFALNQRYEVATGTGKANQFTISDLLNNIPGSPVRSNDGNSVRALGGGRLDFDVAGALEYVSTMAEARSGVVRNAQGLNPDTLHETARGAQMLANAAMKRVRMICRVFAETGIKDTYLLLHDAIRTHVPQSVKAELRGKWVDVSPTDWGARKDMTIHVGVGSGGREMEMAGLNLIAERMAQIAQAQNGFNGPIVTLENVYNVAKRMAELTGQRDPGRYFTEPPKKDPNAPPEPPAPDPEMVKAQMEAQQKAQQAQSDAELKRYEIDQKAALQREQMMLEAQLKREQMELEARLSVVGVGTGGSGVRFGGEPG